MIKRLLMILALSLPLAVSATGIPGAPDEGEPDIRISYKEDKTYYEYRIGGQLKEIKVVPAVGKPYYLVPSDDGSFARFDESSLLLPKWVIFRW